MKAMLLHQIADLTKETQPLVLKEVDPPIPDRSEVLIKISTCGVCHTELDEIEGKTPPPHFPVIPGHQVVGRVVEAGPDVRKLKPGDRVGVSWIFHSCGKCDYCLEGNENLCSEFQATGRDVHGGYAEYMKVGENFAFPIPAGLKDEEAAPLFCAGAIGYRSLRLTNLKNGQLLGLTGFGASGHLVLKLVKHCYPSSKVYVFVRNETQRQHALKLGAEWAGFTEDESPEKLHAIIDTTPAWKPLVEALKSLRPGGRLVVNAIRKEKSDKNELLRLNYEKHLWMEKEIKSVANVAKRDVSEFLQLADELSIKPDVQHFELKDANRALIELKKANNRGAKVLRVTV